MGYKREGDLIYKTEAARGTMADDTCTGCILRGDPEDTPAYKLGARCWSAPCYGVGYHGEQVRLIITEVAR